MAQLEGKTCRLHPCTGKLGATGILWSCSFRSVPLLTFLNTFSFLHHEQAQVEAKKEHEGAVQLLEVSTGGWVGLGGLQGCQKINGIRRMLETRRGHGTPHSHCPHKSALPWAPLPFLALPLRNQYREVNQLFLNHTAWASAVCLSSLCPLASCSQWEVRKGRRRIFF